MLSVISDRDYPLESMQENIAGYVNPDKGWDLSIINSWSANPCKSFVKEYSMWADGYVWVVSDTTTGNSVSGISADTKEDAIKNYIENCM